MRIRASNHWIAPLVGLLVPLVLASSCTHVYTRKGAYTRVRQGDTLASIARRYRVDVQELAEINNIEGNDDLKVGRHVYIPGVSVNRFAAIIEREGKPRKRSSVARRRQREPVQASLIPSDSVGAPTIRTDRGRFAWPVEGEVSSLYGIRHGRKHDGIDIRAKYGSPVSAAADGEVVYSKRLRGYGNLILVKHRDEFFTVYAHNSVNLVKKGARVKKGQLIAKIGRTGRASGPHLHFEVREGTKARNPLFFLPKTQYAQKARERETAYGGPNGEVEGEDP